ncbi:hypothetical protein P9Z71_03535 [Glaesserella parasuis]|uniref:hypothetical protein n=1 Tax=Glaesserella parasuis TaxID=738 RepID=UPI002436F36A|nr:hypothetical protein [Glaesserella parasuis]MDG6309301.1 hypothetical protein [Glaesserella parasuis]MDO9960461.1 hypothetical protein [Glaesserella parasuis]
MDNLYEKGREDGFEAFSEVRLTPMELNVRGNEYVRGYIDGLCEMYMNRSELEAIIELNELAEHYSGVPRALPVIQLHLDSLS